MLGLNAHDLRRPRVCPLQTTTALRMQRALLSPRALQQGWREELDASLLQQRSAITAAKLDCVFGPTREGRAARDEKDGRDRILQDLVKVTFTVVPSCGLSHRCRNKTTEAVTCSRP